ncbi:MAG: type II toxin-antitoxin system HipA family toxin [Gammaproteobacteria bacterium]|nr:type II toxin-antitoxin system HipA family toxin [Gammaproteobacteria bacterium]
MTSSTECYVYIALPGQTDFVTAGRFSLEKDRQGAPVGRFVYGRNYLAREDAVPIDPFELKLDGRTYENRRLNGVFGALRDASPDYWGRRIIEKYAGVAELEELDYLLHSADDRAGALGFGLGREPPAPRRKFNRTMDLEKLQAIADAVIEDKDLPDDPDAQQAYELLGGTSIGGARPKTVVEDDEGLWIAKFNRADDRWNHARIEHAMLFLARRCGIHAAESRVTRIGDRDALLVRRFDRQKTEAGYRRARMLSALTLLRADENERDRWSYVVLAEELRRLSSLPLDDAKELYRRMVFNALISNTDDHPRNHAVIALSEDWKLSPAYDLTPSSPPSQERRDLALVCGDEGRYANASNLLSQCERFQVKRDEAITLMAEMEQTVRAHWHASARACGVSEQDCERLSGAFAYPGFRIGWETVA